MSEKWSPGWLSEGYFVSYEDFIDEVIRYAFIRRREFSHVEFDPDEYVTPGIIGGPWSVPNLEVTVTRKQVFQTVFGLKYKGKYYVNLPSDVKRHGVPKRTWPTLVFPWVAHYEEWMSPWDQPDWCTEHFLIRPMTERISFSYYNPHDYSVLPRFNFFINKCDLEMLGYEEDGVLHPSKNRYAEILDKLFRRVVRHRPLSLRGVVGPAEAP